MNLTRLRAAENPPEPVCFLRSAMRASSSASQLDVGSLVTVCPSSEYEMTGDPDNKADSTLSRIDSYSASLSDAERAMFYILRPILAARYPVVPDVWNTDHGRAFMQRAQSISRHCESCRRRTRFERHVTAMGCGDLLLVVLSLGLWLPIRWLLKPGFRCVECGSR